ncbi:MAG: hypothetical protein AMJ69_11915 [Gammaproteobacteria bacterium SG8_47]|nr:MAG: hypothetical protein AMJ69_11915 [Gammaproteobacteria bacterium SG8_47]
MLSIGAYLAPVHAEDAQAKADAAVAHVLFDYEGSFEFVSYAVNEKGFVDVTFARNIPDALYREILTKLQNHPDVDGVLSGKGGPPCRLW